MRVIRKSCSFPELENHLQSSHLRKHYIMVIVQAQVPVLIIGGSLESIAIIFLGSVTIVALTTLEESILIKGLSAFFFYEFVFQHVKI